MQFVTVFTSGLFSYILLQSDSLSLPRMPLMTEPDLTPSPNKRGPRTPEGKARFSLNALRHGLRARSFALLPEEDPAEWAMHLADLRAGYGPIDAAEEKLVTALAVAMWKEIRADKQEAEVLAAIPPLAPGRPCGGDLQQPGHALSLNTAVRYATAAGMAVQRAQRAFLAHRKAVRAGLVLPGAAPAPAEAANQNRTNDVQPSASVGAVVAMPPPRPASAKPAKAKAADAPLPEAELDDAAWLASLPVVEADPEREAERRRALLQVLPREVRRTIGHAPLSGIEHYLVAGDPVANEAWFTRQPKPPRVEMAFMTEQDVAAVNWVTRHNPPWARGKYLGYYRPPGPAHLFEPGAVGEEEPPQRPAFLPAPAEPAPAAATPPTPLADLRARVQRLLDRTQPRLAEELDLAEAICAVKWPKWPEYRGPIDPFLLRRALVGTIIDTPTLHWLGSQELAQACREDGQQ